MAESMIRQALWRPPTPCQPMVAVPEDEKLWEDLGKIAVANLGDWYQRVPPLWSCRTGHLLATS
eukprot:5747837-Alexandrium_andersonii.AAC.1